LIKPFTKKGWWSGSRCRPRIQTPSTTKKKKKERKKRKKGISYTFVGEVEEF
jgi:hypothetical protein